MDKKSVFISYSNHDALDFTRRLAFGLGLYMDVFWDRRLKAGDFIIQLDDEIEKRDFLLFVMSPFSFESKWCRYEFQRAQELKKVLY